MRCTEHRHHPRALGIVERDDDDAGVTGDPGVRAGDRDAPRPVEDASRIEGHLPLEEVIQRVAVEQRTRPDEHEPLLEVGYVEVAVERVYRLLEIGGVVRAGRVGGRGGGCRNAGRVGGPHVELLPQR